MLIGTGIRLAIPEQLIGLFSSNPETIRLGGTGTDTHQRGLFDFGSFHHILRCAGGTRKRRIFPDLPSAESVIVIPSGSLPVVPSGRRRFRMARLLDHRGHFRSGFSLWYTAAQ